MEIADPIARGLFAELPAPIQSDGASISKAIKQGSKIKMVTSETS